MDKPYQYRHEGFSEGDPGNIHPDEVNRKEPAKQISAVEDLKIKESQLGRDIGQTPADEHIEEFSQIADDSKQVRESEHEESMSQTLKKEFDTDDFNRVDERDMGDSSEDWDAERSRTGRQK